MSYFHILKVDEIDRCFDRYGLKVENLCSVIQSGVVVDIILLPTYIRLINL